MLGKTFQFTFPVESSDLMESQHQGNGADIRNAG